MGWTFYNSNGQRLSTATTLIDNLDIDGATDIGAAIVDADLFIIDDGAGGTNRKTAASRIKTYAGTTQAVQSDIEAETNEDTYIPPDLIKHSPGVAKAWCMIEQNGTLSGASYPDVYNIDSLTDTGTGDRTVVFDVDFSSGDYSFISTVSGGTSQYGTIACGPALASVAAGSVRIHVVKDSGYNETVNAVDEAHCFVAFGDQ